jgi:hypothetical protein
MRSPTQLGVPDSSERFPDSCRKISSLCFHAYRTVRTVRTVVFTSYEKEERKEERVTEINRSNCPDCPGDAPDLIVFGPRGSRRIWTKGLEGGRP